MNAATARRERPRVGLVSLGVGLAAAGVGAAVGLGVERAAMGRPLLPGRRGAADGEDYGGLRAAARIVRTDDGVGLHVEVDEADPGLPHGYHPGVPQVTVVFIHGYSLNCDSWHFQRKALRGRYRMVFWDQRGHGRSGPGPDGSATIDQVGRDLYAVLAAAVPEGPVVLVGHSMGGMTIMSTAQEHPELFADRVVGVVLLSTSAGGLAEVDFGMPRVGRLLQRMAPAAVKLVSRTPTIVERGRRLGSDLESVLVRRYSYASDVSPELVAFTADMIASTRVDVISQFLPTFSEHDKRAALATLHGIELLVIVGDSDLLTPVSHSDEIVHHLPGAEHIVVRDGGHLLMLEHPDVVTGHVVELIERALRAYPDHGKATRRGRVRRTVTPMRRRRRRRDGAA